MKKICLAPLLLMLCLHLFISSVNAQNCWSALSTGAGQNTYTDAVTAMATFNGNLIIGGYFDTVGGIPANDIAAWNGSSWTALGPGINKKIYGGFYNGINAMAVFNNELYVGGSFDTAGGMPVNGIAKWDGTSWTSVGGGITGYISGTDTSSSVIESMAVYNGSLYVAGGFYYAGSTTALNIARWDGTSWSAVGGGIGNLGQQNGVACLTSYNGLLYAGGDFLTASSLNAQNIASWNGTTWAALGGGVGPDTLGQGGVLSIAPYDGGILAAVASENAQYYQQFSVAKWDGTGWTSFAGGPGTGVYYPGILLNMFPFNGDLIAEGSFYQLGNDTSAKSLEIWNGSTWGDFGGLSDTSLYTTATVYNQHLYVGGAYAGVGNITTRNIAEYICQTTAAINPVAASRTVQVYPNPTGGIINLSVDNLQAESTVRIYNLMGERVYQSVLTNGKNEIDLTGAAKGVYFYRLAGGNGESVASGSLVVQ